MTAIETGTRAPHLPTTILAPGCHPALITNCALPCQALQRGQRGGAVFLSSLARKSHIKSGASCRTQKA